MTEAEFKKLEVGDVVTSVEGYGYIVTERISETELIAVRTVTMSIPKEWKLFKKKK
jgi:hypothetical protein